jgi:hypothetical protein
MDTTAKSAMVPPYSAARGQRVMRRRCLELIVAVALAGAASPALAGHAVTYFPTPQWTEGLGTEIKTYDGQDSIVSPTATAPAIAMTSQTLEGASATAWAATSESPYPDLSATASASLVGNAALSSHGGAAATLYYSFEISGPAGNVPTIISATGSASTEAGGSAVGGAIAILEIYSTSGILFSDTACSGEGEYACAAGEIGTIALDQDFSLVANQYYNVYMSIAADGFASQLYSVASSQASGAASLDPYILIDPTFADAGDYSLYVTPGIGNATATPEPAAWTMTLAGLGMLGATLRLRRQPGVRLTP